MASDPLDDKVDEAKEDISSYFTPKVITTEELGKYHKNRPLGKLYNIGLTIRKSSQLLEALLYA